MPVVTLPDGSTRAFPNPITVAEAAAAIGKRLAADAVAGRVDGRLVDTSHVIDRDCALQIVTRQSPEAQEILRHSAAHILAQAVARLWGPVRLWVGPPLLEGRYGFYYDMDLDHRITPEDFPKIEAEMMKIAAEDLAPRRFEMPAAEAEKLAERMGQPYKVELIRGFGVPAVSFYEQGEFTDLCEGPHIPRTGLVGGVKIMNVTGAYLRGDPSQKMLQRVYGCAFYTKKELDAHLARWADAEKRDHRRLGTDLDLFSLDPVAPGSPFFHPKGAFLYTTLVDYIRSLYPRYGYDEVITPLIFKTDLWKTSGHYETFLDGMFMMRAEDAEYGAKPMNCPGHCVLYATRRRSYRELPIRFAEFSRLHRYEKSGVLSGLTRVRSFAQDDAHIFCMASQVDDEFDRFWDMTQEVYKRLGLGTPEIFLETCPPEYLGTPQMRERSEATLRAWLDRIGLPYTVNAGQGTHYAPKVAFNFRDTLDRSWTLSTIQLDLVLPMRFRLSYVSADGKPEPPVMLHRAILGSLERFIGIYIEHTGGDFPLWLAPVQARVLTITDKQFDTARRTRQALRDKGLRVEVDLSSDKIGAKVRRAIAEKIPYMAVIGEQEASEGVVAVRHKSRGDLGRMALPAFTERLLREASIETS